MRNFIKEHKKNFLLLSFFSFFVMFFAGFYTNKLGHDMGFHVTNIENLKEYLDPLKGRFLAFDISPNIGNHLGYGLYLFYPSLPHLIYAYLYKFLSIFGIDILTSILITNIFLTISSSFLIYILSYKCYQNKKCALLSSFIFIIFPYRLSSIFIRYALNESLLFLFVPLILLSLFYLKEKKYKLFSICFCIGYIGSIYSHLVMSFYFTILLLPYICIYHKLIFQKESLKVLIASILFVGIVVFPSIISIIEHMDKEYLVYLENYMTSIELVKQNILSFSSYFLLDTNDWNIQFYIPAIVILFLIISFLYFKKERDSFLHFFLLEIIFIFCMISLVPWEYFPKKMLLIQFPWRLQTYLLIYISLFAPYFLKRIHEAKQSYILFFIIMILCFGSYPLLYHIQNRQYEVVDREVLKQYGVGNLGEYYPNEYYTKGKEYYNKRKPEVINLTNDKALIENKKASFPNFAFRVTTNGFQTQIELPRIYYKGYVLKKKGKEYPITRSSYGLIECNVADGEYILVYQKSFLKRMSLYIKYGFLLVFFVFGMILKKKVNTFFKWKI